MLKVSDVVSLFHAEKFVRLTFLPLPKGHIEVVVRGSLQGKAEKYFGQFCDEVLCQTTDPFTAEDDSPFVERWLLVPTAEHRHALSDVLVRAWRRYSAENGNPFFNVENVSDEGWGECRGKQTTDQIKSVLLLLLLHHKVRVFHNQAAACAATYGANITPDSGYIALDIDGRVYLVSPNGYFHGTMLTTTGTDCED